jgi:hypothetical protein
MHGDTAKVQCNQCDRMIKMCTLDQHTREEHGTPRYSIPRDRRIKMCTLDQHTREEHGTP